MVTVKFPVLKETLKMFVKWQTQGRTSTTSLDDIFNDTIKKMFDKGHIAFLMDNSIRWRTKKAERGSVSVSLDDDVYDRLEDFRTKYGDIKYVQLKELIAEYVKISCEKANEIINTEQ